MTPERIKERLSDIGEKFDRDEFYSALEYVHDDGRTRE
jgi:hypothetical protein